MPICLKHCQIYNQDEYCVYCGNPYKIITATTTAPIDNIEICRKPLYNVINGEITYCQNKKPCVLHDK